MISNQGLYTRATKGGLAGMIAGALIGAVLVAMGTTPWVLMTLVAIGAGLGVAFGLRGEGESGMRGGVTSAMSVLLGSGLVATDVSNMAVIPVAVLLVLGAPVLGVAGMLARRRALASVGLRG